MRRSRKPIPISAAKRVAKDYGYDQVVIIARKVGVHGVDEDASEHVTTYGVSKAHCESAALQGKALKRFMGWPEETPTTNAVGGHRHIASVTTESVGDRGSRLVSYELTEEGEAATTVRGPCPEGGNHEFVGHDVQCLALAEAYERVKAERDGLKARLRVDTGAPLLSRAEAKVALESLLSERED